MAGELDLSIKMHRKAYQVMPSAQQAYVLFQAMPTAAAPSVGQPPVNFGLVLDRSGSMAGERLRRMKEAAKLVIDRLGSQDMISIVIFDERADIVVPAGPVQDRENLKQLVERIDERGGTHMSSGMQVGFQEVQKGLQPNRVNRILLLTDGQTWEDGPQCEAIADQCRMAGVPLNVMGLGVGGENTWDPRFLENLARRSGGDWTVIDNPDQVSSVFEKTLQSMQGTAVTNARLVIRFVEGVAPRAVWRVIPMISRLDANAVSERDVQIFFGDVQHGVGQCILADLMIPARSAGSFRLMQVDIHYDVPGTGLTGEHVSADVIVNYTPDETLANQTDPMIMNLAERVLAHKLQTQALDEAAVGDVVRATRRLRAAATRLLEIGEAELSEQAMEQAQKLEHDGRMDPAAAQQMRYATKKLTESQNP